MSDPLQEVMDESGVFDIGTELAIVLEPEELVELADWISACVVTTHRPTFPLICQQVLAMAQEYRTT